jgi:hypothetical protein
MAEDVQQTAKSSRHDAVCRHRRLVVFAVLLLVGISVLLFFLSQVHARRMAEASRERTVVLHGPNNNNSQPHPGETYDTSGTTATGTFDVDAYLLAQSRALVTTTTSINSSNTPGPDPCGRTYTIVNRWYKSDNNDAYATYPVTVSLTDRAGKPDSFELEDYMRIQVVCASGSEAMNNGNTQGNYYYYYVQVLT